MGHIPLVAYDLDQLVADYRVASQASDTGAMRRLETQEASVVLISMLAALSEDPSSFVHRVALKGGVLMLAELGSPRFSTDLDFTYAKHGDAAVDPADIADDLRRAGASFGLRVQAASRSRFGVLIEATYVSRCLGRAVPTKAEISLRENLVFGLREAYVDGEPYGLTAFSVPALDYHDLVAEKLRALSQRAQPRDLYDLWFYLCQAKLPLVGPRFEQAVQAKFTITGQKRYSREPWRKHLDAVRAQWNSTLSMALGESVPDFDACVTQVGRALKVLGVD